jgi:mRNA-degrading endonuclease RelE of RelBE toxin-antitoxin system
MWITVIEFQQFSDDADRLFTPDELEALINLLAINPEIGVVIRGTGGIRKLRVPLERKGKGKRGGARLIYFYFSDELPVALLAVYAKGEKIDLSAADKKELKSLIDEYVKEHKKKRALNMRKMRIISKK